MTASVRYCYILRSILTRLIIARRYTQLNISPKTLGNMSSNDVRSFLPAQAPDCAYIRMREQDGAPPPVGSRGPGGFAPDSQSDPRPAPLGANPEYVNLHTPAGSYT